MLCYSNGTDNEYCLFLLLDKDCWWTADANAAWNFRMLAVLLTNGNRSASTLCLCAAITSRGNRSDAAGSRQMRQRQRGPEVVGAEASRMRGAGVATMSHIR